MPVAIECSDCKKRYAVEQRALGRTVKCKQCGNVFTAHPTAAAPPAPSPSPSPSFDDPPDFDAIVALAQAESAYAPAPPGPSFIPPPVPATPPRALAVVSGYAFRPARSKWIAAVGIDSATPWLILINIGLELAFLVMGLVGISSSDAAPGISKGKAREALISLIICHLILFFALAVTAVWGALLIASKAMRFPMDGPSAYFKAAGIASVPMIALECVLLLNPNLPLLALIVLATLPAVFFVTRFALSLRWVEAVVTFLIAMPLYAGAQLLVVFVLIAALLSLLGVSLSDVIHQTPGVVTTSRFSAPPADPTPPGPTAPDSRRVDFARQFAEQRADEQIKSDRETFAQIEGEGAGVDLSREDAMARFASVLKEIAFERNSLTH